MESLKKCEFCSHEVHWLHAWRNLRVCIACKNMLNNLSGGHA